MLRKLCEELEQRRHLSGVRLATDGYLLVVGVVNVSNTITVGMAPGDQSVTATLSYSTTKTGPITISQTYPQAGVKRVSLVGGNAADVITVDDTYGSLPCLVLIRTGNGNDVVTGGDEPDRIICGRGVDIVNAGGGNNQIFGGIGPQTLIGGDGNDAIKAGFGLQELIGGGGNDTLSSGRAYDTLLGGVGNNTFVSTALRLEVNDYVAGKDRYIKLIAAPPKSDSLLDDVLSAFNPLSQI